LCFDLFLLGRATDFANGASDFLDPLPADFRQWPFLALQPLHDGGVQPKGAPADANAGRKTFGPAGYVSLNRGRCDVEDFR
jgi:hypothetical protein